MEEEKDYTVYQEYDYYEKKSIPVCTILLIAINVLIYFVTLKFNDFTRTGGANYQYIIEKKEYGRLLSSIFLHLGLTHITSNMIALFLFGNIVEKEFGSLKMTIIYFMSGIGGGVLSLIGHKIFVPNTISFSVGASGAIYGLMAATIIITLKREGISYIKNIAFFALYLAVDMKYSWEKQVDVFAHLGGAIIGCIVAFIVIKMNQEKEESKIRKIIAVVIIILLSIVAVKEANLGGKTRMLDEEIIKSVKSGYMNSNPDITFDKAFSEYFDNSKWEVVLSEEDKEIVEYTGTYNKKEKVVEVKIKFSLNEEEKKLGIDSLYYDDKEQSREILNTFIREIFYSYEKNHNIK